MASIGSIYISGVLTSQFEINSSGSISTPLQSLTIKVYSDAACTIETTSLTWGSIQPGGSATQTVYVKNLGNIAATLSSTFTAWTPSGTATYIHPSWNREGALISAGSVLSAVITLNVDSGITGITTFSFKIVVTGIG
jgi:hypothetical protein